ncbi:MAG: CBASS system CD-NTase-associated NAD(+) hydrolase Cap12 [Bacteroidales bacterium]
MKPRIFIGSSSEGLEIAQRVKSYFEKEYECFLWTDGIFKFNENFLETLMKEASLFDFGFLVFTKDDYTESRTTTYTSPRDNVVFEYGLFLGRLGRERAYFIIDEDVKLPSDLQGITTVNFKYQKKKGFCNKKSKLILNEESLITNLKRLKVQIDEKVHLGVLGMLPSTVLAIGYFDNFIQPICEYLSTRGTVIELKGVTYDKFKFKIILPKDLDSDIKSRATVFYNENKFELLEIPTSRRPYPLFVAVDTEENTLILSDMPTTISGIDKAIEMYLRVGHIGKSNEQQLLEERELRNFGSVLKHLTNADACSKSVVEIEIES